MQSSTPTPDIYENKNRSKHMYLTCVTNKVSNKMHFLGTA